MKKVEIDLKNLSSIEEVHEQLKAALDFPSYYGKNLDALYDCLTDISEDTCVGIRGPKEGGIAWYLPRMQRVFDDAEKENPHLCVFFLLDEKESVQADEAVIRQAAEKSADIPAEGETYVEDPSGDDDWVDPEAAEMMGLYTGTAGEEAAEEEPAAGPLSMTGLTAAGQGDPADTEICAVQPDPDETEEKILRAGCPGPEAAEIMGAYGAAVREDPEQ